MFNNPNPILTTATTKTTIRIHPLPSSQCSCGTIQSSKIEQQSDYELSPKVSLGFYKGWFSGKFDDDIGTTLTSMKGW
jgi:hypothetical protein